MTAPVVWKGKIMIDRFAVANTLIRLWKCEKPGLLVLVFDCD